MCTVCLILNLSFCTGCCVQFWYAFSSSSLICMNVKWFFCLSIYSSASLAQSLCAPWIQYINIFAAFTTAPRRLLFLRSFTYLYTHTHTHTHTVLYTHARTHVRTQVHTGIFIKSTPYKHQSMGLYQQFFILIRRYSHTKNQHRCTLSCRMLNAESNTRNFSDWKKNCIQIF